MKTRSKTILMLLLFVVLISPLKVNAFQPILDPLYDGIYVELFKCESDSAMQQQDYFIDVIIPSYESDDDILEDGNGLPYPSAIDTEGYGNINNQWISLSKFHKDAPTIRDDCRVNFFGDVEHPDDLSYTMYKVVVYLDDELVLESLLYDISNISYDDRIGDMIFFHPVEDRFSTAAMYGDESSYEPIEIHRVIFSLFFYGALIGFIICEGFLYLFNKIKLRQILILYAFNLMMGVSVNLVGTMFHRLEWSYIIMLLVFGLSIGILSYLKLLVLSKMEFPPIHTSRVMTLIYLIGSWVCLIIMAI